MQTRAVFVDIEVWTKRQTWSNAARSYLPAPPTNQLYQVTLSTKGVTLDEPVWTKRQKAFTNAFSVYTSTLDLLTGQDLYYDPEPEPFVKPQRAFPNSFSADQIHALSGQVITSSTGAIQNASLTLTLNGLSIASRTGNVVYGGALVLPLTGQSIVSAQGAIAHSNQMALSGLSVNSTTGAVTAIFAGNVTAALAPQSIAVSTGTIVAIINPFVPSGPNYMPNLYGLNYFEAVEMLQAVNIYVPVPPYAFLPEQITVQWIKSALFPEGGIVVAQSITAGTYVKKGTPITLTVADFPMSGIIN